MYRYPELWTIFPTNLPELYPLLGNLTLDSN